jgi:hypothetical protein
VTSPGVLRLRTNRTALLAVLFLVFGVTPLAFVRSWLLVLYLAPALAVLWIYRVGTDIDSDGVTVRALFGVRRVGWDEVRGLSMNGARKVRLVLSDGQLLRMPLVRARDLPAIAVVSGGRVPDVTAPEGDKREQPSRGSPPTQ